MQAGHFWRYGALGICSGLVLFGLTLIVGAQSTPATTPAWESAEEEESSGLTLVWQTTFTSETAISSPGDIAIDMAGNVYVSTQSANTVKKFDAEGNMVASWGGGGKGDGQFSLSFGIGVDADNHVYVTDFYNRRIQKFDSDGAFLAEWATEPSTSPAFLVIDWQGNILIDQFPPHDEHYVAKFDNKGTLLTEWGNADKKFGGLLEDIAVDTDGNLYIADVLEHRVQKLSPTGELVASFGGVSSREGKGLFDDPFGVTVDKDGYIYVLDSNFLQKLDADGNFVASWSTDGGELDQASNVAVDWEGNIYVFARAEVVAPSGDTVTVPLLKKFSQSSAW